MKIFRYAVTLVLSAFAVPQAMACFTVYNRASQTVYSNMDPPIDMSYQIHERLPAAFPGGHMVFGNSTDCPVIDTRRSAPVLTNVSARAVRAKPRRARRMTTAERNREQDSLTK
jgi:hypothetical protein